MGTPPVVSREATVPSRGPERAATPDSVRPHVDINRSGRGPTDATAAGGTMEERCRRGRNQGASSPVRGSCGRSAVMSQSRFDRVGTGMCPLAGKRWRRPVLVVTGSTVMMRARVPGSWLRSFLARRLRCFCPVGAGRRMRPDPFVLGGSEAAAGEAGSRPSGPPVPSTSWITAVDDYRNGEVELVRRCTGPWDEVPVTVAWRRGAPRRRRALSLRTNRVY